MTSETIQRIKELAAAGKSRAEIRVALSSEMAAHPELEEMLEVLIPDVAPVAAMPVAPSPTTPPITPIEVGATGSATATNEQQRSRHKRVVRAVIILVLSVGILGFLAIAGYLGWRVVSSQINPDATTIDRMQQQASEDGQEITTSCFTVKVSAALNPRTSGECGVIGQQPSPLALLTVSSEASERGSQSPEQAAKNFSGVVGSLGALSDGNNCGPAHATQIEPRVVRNNSSCTTKEGHGQFIISYALFGDTTNITVIGVSSSLETNPAPAVYQLLKPAK